MLKRLFDIIVSAAGLVLLSPFFLLVAVGIRLASPGPILYRSVRVGRNGEPFTMHKFRTMHVSRGPADSPITAPNDARVFTLGSLLRRLKIDELPQLYDVLRGKMSLVGPRPEDPRIVRDHYTPADRETLRVLPGLTSPGSIYDYTHGDRILAQGDPDQVYLERLLPVKLALETVYVREATFCYDLAIVLRTIAVLFLIAAGKRHFADPPEMRKVSRAVAGDVR
jgi:lipopolysaccharide/colanic/teichoic acid biosynthesis glycosyltransferase